jgi:hypothetical protein
MLSHVIKIPAVIVLGSLSVTEFGVPLIVMAAAVVPGTILGKRILRGVSPAMFVTLYKIALTVAGLKVLLVDGLGPFITPYIALN